MTTYPKRLIEVDLPIKRISAHARREKSIRHGHISTLHIWWARRPLAACRAVICASLWPDPADPLCPPAFRQTATAEINAFAQTSMSDKRLSQTASDISMGRWNTLAKAPLDATNPGHWNTLRYALLDFIADFANWDNSTNETYLSTSRALTQAAHEALGGQPGTRPLVVDPFAGGGAIPLEALRVGADAFASDLNPVAVLLNKVVLEYIPKYGQELADEVRKWGTWIKEQAELELAEFYPHDPDGATPIAYLWARTIISEAPDDGTGVPIEIPLISSFWLSKKSKQLTAMRWKRDAQGRIVTTVIEKVFADGKTYLIGQPQLEIFQPKTAMDVEEGTVTRGAATCPITGFTTPLTSVKSQLSKRYGGTSDPRLFAVYLSRSETRERFFRLPTQEDIEAVVRAEGRLTLIKSTAKNGLSPVPDESTLQYDSFSNRGPLYGLSTWEDYFTPRQSLALVILTELLDQVSQEIMSEMEPSLYKAVISCLGLAISKQADSNSSLSSWRASSQDIGHTFGRQALVMVWDFAEANVISGATRDWSNAVEGGLKALESLDPTIKAGQADQGDAAHHSLANGSADAYITDPPYYYSVQYADLSDFFYVWLRRSLMQIHPELFSAPLTPKDAEIIVQSPSHVSAPSGKNTSHYESHMQQAMAEGRRILKPDGVGVVVFAHTSTAGWEAQLQAMIGAGWTITASWPIDTEMASRVIAKGRAVLASSIHLVCRPRENSNGELDIVSVGDWRDVLQELPQRIHAWLPRLADEGVVGADAIFACLGPALEVFSRYSRVERANGEVVTLGEYLEQVWAAVSREALEMVFAGADTTGFEEDARLTAAWLWTLSADGDDSPGPNGKTVASTGYALEYDAARKIAQGLGVHLEQLPGLVEVKGSTARLLPVAERTRTLFGKEGLGTTGGRAAKSGSPRQLSWLESLPAEEAAVWAVPEAASIATSSTATTLDHVHLSMLLFAAGQSDALRRFLVDDGIGQEERFWRLAQALSALYPAQTDEKRWVDGVLARKKGLGF